MRPSVWRPAVELSAAEQGVVRRIRRAKLFVFLREHRHELLDEPFQAELAAAYKDSAKGQPPVPPAQLALVTVLQAYTGASDDEAVEALAMDRRWQLVADCLGAEDPPFSKGTLVNFRALLVAHDLDRRLVERTVELAERTGSFGARALRAALDSSPLWGAGRVEDTYNLLGHALRKALGVLARQQGRGLADVAADAGAPLLAASSLKAALDLDWDDPASRADALARVLAALDAVEAYAGAAAPPAAAADALGAARRVREQDVEVGPDGAPALRRGVAPDRRISVEDAQMRHGRKSKSARVDGYKRHALRDLDRWVVRAVALTAANEPDAAATDEVAADLARQAAVLAELHIDRGYLSSALVRDRPPDLAVFCKAWPVRNADRFPKTAFALDWEAGTIRCPAGQVLPFAVGGTVHFPANTCAACPLRAACTTSAHGRSVAIHPDEQLLVELRERQRTAAGRAALRERVAVEHSLAQIGRWQGRRARYVGRRKNLFDLRRAAVVHNLHVLARLAQAAPIASQAA
jgi:transposase